MATLDPFAQQGVTPPTRRGGSGRFLADVLVDLGFVDRGRMQAAATMAAGSGGTAESILIDSGELDHGQLARAVAERFGLDHLDLSRFQVDIETARLITPAAARRYQAVPVAQVDGRTVLVAMVDPANVLAVDDIAVMTGFEVRPAVASQPDIERLLDRLAGGGGGVATAGNTGQPVIHPNRDQAPVPPASGGPPPGQQQPMPASVAPMTGATSGFGTLGRISDDASVISLVQRIITEAADRGASDIHFEPQEERMRVRYRVDGVLAEAASIPSELIPSVVSRIKIMGELDIAERRLPQDGRVSLDFGERMIDIRVVTLPSAHGEGVVMRILDRSNMVVELDKLGMLPHSSDRFRTAISQSYGAVLVTGPTGSGKSTTLYGALNLLNTPEKNIITIEDPVEYQLTGVTQVQVNTKAGLTFGTGLRSMMRADPDIIMVGEIRDHETAQIAVEAALTGHLVLSTLHTNDAPTAITRLIEMGIEPFLVASAVDCVVAQRLARKLCEECRRPTVIPAAVLHANGYPAERDMPAFEPVGCPRCGGNGYKGRIGLYEVMWLGERIRQMAVARDTADAIAEVAVAEGMVTLRDDGMQKVAMGLTSITEVARVAGSR